jgi:hypothetical protein
MIKVNMQGEENLVFGDVEEDQFFVVDGSLCQKYDRDRYHVIACAYKEGLPNLTCSHHDDVSPDMPIQRIINVLNIQF